MTAPSRLSAEPVTDFAGPGGRASGAIGEAVAVAREWAGEGLVALLLSGSHATGEGVWLEHEGRGITLSDADLYAVMADERACREGAARARAGRPAAAERLRRAGLEAPLEVGFLTRAGLARMGAKPGTIELARHGRVVAGDPGALAEVPRFAPRDVPAEETALLLENRGLELLAARPPAAARGPLERARALHGTLKAAADLAAVLALRAGELPDGTAARVAWARERAAAALAPVLSPDRLGLPAELGRLWDDALAWRTGRAHAPTGDEAAGAWRSAVRAWCAVWDAGSGGTAREPWERALRSAARAPLRRRLRRALSAPAAGSPLRRLALTLAGTPQHRVNASAAVLLAAAAASRSTPALPAGALRALHALGVSGASGWEEACRDVVRAWDAVVLGGQRGTDGR
jgi:hypothetical protein